jgi:signal transduction histidine kinase
MLMDSPPVAFVIDDDRSVRRALERLVGTVGLSNHGPEAGDPVQFQQVLINLIMNAIEATRSSTNGRRKILIRSAKNPDGVLIQVQDSGAGIDPAPANRVSEPFFATKARGIGMALSIGHSITESHGGRLGIVPSSTGALSEFTLPIDDAGVS